MATRLHSTLLRHLAFSQNAARLAESVLPGEGMKLSLRLCLQRRQLLIGEPEG
jgi:hypothetical protein